MTGLFDSSSFARTVCYAVLFITVCLNGSPIQGDNTVTNFTQPYSSQYLPSEWNSVCNLKTNQNRTIGISCHVTAQGSWDFRLLRNWSAALENGTMVLVDVVCDTGGRICLPWPYRSPHLHTLRLRNCINTCFYAESDQPEVSLPNDLRVLEEYDVTKQISLVKLMYLTLHPDADCGPLNLEVFKVRNCSSEILPLPGQLSVQDDKNITNAFIGNIGKVNELEHICIYRYMRVYDYSNIKNATTTTLYTTLINSRFPELRVLNLSRLQIPSFPSELQAWRRRFVKLDILDLSHNNISRFDLTGMSLLSRDVGLIDLTDNNIRTIGFREIQSFKNVKRAIIDIRGNPLTCDCAMANFTHFLQAYHTPESAGLDAKYSYLWQLRCEIPAKFKDKRIAEISRHILCTTDVSNYIVQICVLSVAVVFLLFVVVMMAKYRQEVRILVFTRLHIVLPCQPVETSVNKTYDAFVSYSHLDSTWVVKTLLPRLESGPGNDSSFRLCLHQRDFEVGAAIADNIVQSVEASRHTILVLSTRFLESEWCLMEFRTAFHQSLIEKRKHLIIVLLEDIPVDELDSDLRRCLKTMTYIHVSDRLFWDRIIYSLTDKSRSKKMRSPQHVADITRL